jgi:hypothetical protein
MTLQQRASRQRFKEILHAIIDTTAIAWHAQALRADEVSCSEHDENPTDGEPPDIKEDQSSVLIGAALRLDPSLPQQ